MIVEILYPELCCLFGDKANARYLRLALPDAEFVYTGLTETPTFADKDVDMVYIASTTEKGQKILIDTLMPYKARLNEMIDQGKVILATGNAFEIFGEEIKDSYMNETIPALDLVPFRTERVYPDRLNSCYLGEFTLDGEVAEIVGYTSRFANSYYNEGAEPLFVTQKGYTMNPDVKEEGIRKNNFFGTHLLGPFLIQNPFFTKYLLRILGQKDATLPYEKEVYDAYEYRRNRLHQDIEIYDSNTF